MSYRDTYKNLLIKLYGGSLVSPVNNRINIDVPTAIKSEETLSSLLQKIKKYKNVDLNFSVIDLEEINRRNSIIERHFKRLVSVEFKFRFQSDDKFQFTLRELLLKINTEQFNIITNFSKSIINLLSRNHNNKHRVHLKGGADESIFILKTVGFIIFMVVIISIVGYNTNPRQLIKIIFAAEEAPEEEQVSILLNALEEGQRAEDYRSKSQ